MSYSSTQVQGVSGYSLYPRQRHPEHILENVNPRKDDVYHLFQTYFDNPLMKKKKDVQGFSMYICKIHTLLSLEFRYLIAFVYQDKLPVGTLIKLSQLPWVSFQTRTLLTDDEMNMHYYEPRRLEGLDMEITLTKKEGKSSIYRVKDLPISITLLAATDYDEYSDSGSVCIALETYKTIITFV